MQVTSKVYTNKSNARRAAKQAFPEGNFQILDTEGGFGFAGLEIEITSEGEKFVECNDADFTAKPTVHLVIEDKVEFEEEVAAPVINPFARLVQQATGEAVAHAPAAGYNSTKHTLQDDSKGCPLCGANESSVTGVDANQDTSTDNRRLCHECGERFNAVTGQRIRAGYKNENVSRGHKIQKDRPQQNGVKRPSQGTQCGEVWHQCDLLASELGEMALVTAKLLRQVSDNMSWNVNNTLIEFYQWRKFNGVTGRAK